jgi:Phage integrase, N-terminal SAM-like domain
VVHIRRAKTGRGWEARYRDPMGKERGRTFSTKRAAELFLARQSADIQRGDYLDPRLARTTFDEWAAEWVATTVHLKPKTQVSYESILRTRVLPVFATARIASVEQVDVCRFVAELAKAGDEPGTIRNTFNLLRLVFGTAVASGAIRANPCTGVRMPRSAGTEMLFLEPGEILELAESIASLFRTPVLFAAYTGLRAGELWALRVGRLDLLRGIADVRESLADVNGRQTSGIPARRC